MRAVFVPGTALYDLAADPKQARPFRDAAIETRLRAAIAGIMKSHHAPDELYPRYEMSE